MSSSQGNIPHTVDSPEGEIALLQHRLRRRDHQNEQLKEEIRQLKQENERLEDEVVLANVRQSKISSTFHSQVLAATAQSKIVDDLTTQLQQKDHELDCKHNELAQKEHELTDERARSKRQDLLATSRRDLLNTMKDLEEAEAQISRESRSTRATKSYDQAEDDGSSEERKTDDDQETPYGMASTSQASESRLSRSSRDQLAQELEQFMFEPRAQLPSKEQEQSEIGSFDRSNGATSRVDQEKTSIFGQPQPSKANLAVLADPKAFKFRTGLLPDHLQINGLERPQSSQPREDPLTPSTSSGIMSNSIPQASPTKDTESMAHTRHAVEKGSGSNPPQANIPKQPAKPGGKGQLVNEASSLGEGHIFRSPMGQFTYASRNPMWGGAGMRNAPESETQSQLLTSGDNEYQPVHEVSPQTDAGSSYSNNFDPVTDEEDLEGNEVDPESEDELEGNEYDPEAYEDDLSGRLFDEFGNPNLGYSIEH